MSRTARKQWLERMLTPTDLHNLKMQPKEYEKALSALKELRIGKT